MSQISQDKARLLQRIEDQIATHLKTALVVAAGAGFILGAIASHFV